MPLPFILQSVHLPLQICTQFFISAGCWKDCCSLFLSGLQVFHLHPQPSPSVHACLKPPLLSRNTKRESRLKGNFQHNPDILSASPGHCSCSEVSRMEKCSSSRYHIILVMNASMHNHSRLGKVIKSWRIKVGMLLQPYTFVSSVQAKQGENSQ